MCRLALWVLAVLCVAAVSRADDPCTGRITDKLNHPMAPGAVPKPSPGGSYVDPVFGTTITRISAADPAEGKNAVISTLYNSLRGWNADGSQIIAWHRAGARTYEFYQGDRPYAHLGQIVFGGAFSDWTWPADIEQIVWDTQDPNVLYYPAYDGKSSRVHPLLMKVVLSWPKAPVVSLVRDFAPECAAAGVALNPLSLGHGQDMSYEGMRNIGLRCGSTSTGQKRLHFVYSITLNRVVGSYVSTENSPPWPCPSGSCAFRQESKLLYNSSLVQVGTLAMAKAIEHTSMGYTRNGGYDFVAQSAFDERDPGNLIIWKLNQRNPVPTPIISVGRGYPYPRHASHPSMSAKDGSGWIAVGNIGSGLGTAGVLDNEIALANVDTGTVCRVAHARSCDDCPNGAGRGPWVYWAETHPQISNDGWRILFNSDWENSNSVDMYVIDLRRPSSRQQDPPSQPHPNQPPGSPAGPQVPPPNGPGTPTPPTNSPGPQYPPPNAPNGAGASSGDNGGSNALVNSAPGVQSFGGGGEAGYSFAARATTGAATDALGSQSSQTPTPAPGSASALFLSSRGIGAQASPTASVSASTSNPSSQALQAAISDLNAGQYDGAEATLQAAVEQNPGSAAAHYYLGYSYYLRSLKEPGNPEFVRKAADNISQAFRLDPTFRPAAEVLSAH
jgi:hypothetical protein